ncbi:MAG: hydrogenase maturation protease [Bacteroidetes bacterium]|nr:hydrogenase maturation protease [Bacteroidota bacterium]
MKGESTPARSAPTSLEGKKERVNITIVGVGNEFRGDDGAGVLVVRKLREKVPADVRTAELMGDQSDLLELMRSTDALVIIDAVRSSAAAGTIFRVDASEEPMPENFFSFSTHAFDSAQVVELARALKALPRKVIFYGIVGKEFSYTSRLTPDVTESINLIQTNILNEINAALHREAQLQEDA